MLIPNQYFFAVLLFHLFPSTASNMIDCVACYSFSFKVIDPFLSYPFYIANSFFSSQILLGVMEVIKKNAQITDEKMLTSMRGAGEKCAGES